MATVAGSLRNKVLVVDDLTSGDITVTDLVVSGTVTLQGTATTLDSTNTTITDSIIELNSGLTGSNTKDIGFVFERGSTGNNAAFIWDESADRFTVITTTGTASDNTLSGTVANFQAGSFFGNGANLTSLNGTNISSGTVAAARIASLAASKITSGTFANARISSSSVTQHLGSYLTGNQTITLSGDVSGSGTTSISVTVNDDSHFHHRLDSTDDRDMKPSTSGIHNVQAIKPFFSSYGGMTGSGNSTYLDVLALDTYSDSSGGGPSAITFRKGTASGNPIMEIWHAGWNATTWGAGQRVYADNYHPNADTWTTARTITLGGDLSGSVSINGSANVTLTATVADDSHNHVLANVDRVALNSGQNLNDYNTQSIISWGSSQPTNSPGGYSTGFVLQDNNQPQQLVQTYGGVANKVKLYGRRKTSGTWDSTWTQYFSDHYHPNADTLTTARTIAGTSFNGSANIDINYNNLTNKPTIPAAVTNNNQLTNGAGYITDGNTNWNNTYGFITSSDSSITNKLPKAGGTMTGALVVDVDNVANGALRITANQTNPAQDFYFAQEIVSTLSGSGATGGDREQGGIWIDLNSTATGGDTADEHRVYGIFADVDSTGDADVVTAGYFNATATPTTGTTTQIAGVEGFAEDNGGAGATTNIIGVKGTAWSDNSTSDANTLYGGVFKASNAADSGAIGGARGVQGEIELSTSSGDIYGNSYVFDAQYDNNTGAAPTHTAALYYGNYAGELPTTALGVYIVDAVPNSFAGSIRTGLGSTSLTSYGFIGDTNTGMYSPANHQLGFTVNGSRKILAEATKITFQNLSAGVDIDGTLKTNNSVIVTGIAAANNSPATDEVELSGYGLIGNRGNLYLTNSNASGQIVMGISGAHNANPKLTVTTSGITVGGNITVSGTVDGVDIASRNSVLTSTTTTANAALPKAGGTMTGALVGTTATFFKDAAAGTNALNILGVNNGSGAGITFSDNGTPAASNSGQNGYITYYHGNGQSYGSGDSFILSSSETTTTILADGKLMYREGIYSKPASGTGAGTRKDANWDTAYGWGNHASAGYLTSHQSLSALAPKASPTFTGDLTIPNKIIHAGDTNTYIQFHAADQFRVVAGGAEVTEWRNDRMQMNGKSITWDNWLDFDETALSGFTYNVLNAPIHLPAANVGTTNTYLPFLQGSAQHGSGYRTSYVFGAYKRAVLDNGTTQASWGDGHSGFFMGMGGSDSYPTEEFRFSHDGKIWHSGSGSGNTYIDYGDANVLKFNANGSQRMEITAGGTTFNDNVALGGNQLENIGNAYFNEYLYHNGDTDTYIRFEANSMKFRTGGDDRLTVNNSAVTASVPVSATEFDLPSGGMLDWANGDARIVEGLTNNYSLSFQTYNGSAVTTALRLDGNNTATFAGSISANGINMSNTNITNVNHLTFNDSGVNEGLQWLGGNDWRIFESPDALTNASGNLQFTTGGTRRFTITTGGYIGAARTYFAVDRSTGYFYNDSGTRTAYTGGDFYIKSDTSNTYLYSTNTYLGATSGDTIRFRGNTVTADNWGMTSGGNLTISNKIIHNGDTDSYMSFDSADQWKLYCGGQKMIQATEAGSGYDYVSFGGTDNSGEIMFNLSAGDGHFDGNVIAYSTTTTSDRKLKKNIQPLERALEKVQNLKGVSFQWKKDDRESIGFIAQEVQEVVPEVVHNNKKEHDGVVLSEALGVDYGNITALLVEAVKEQQSLINRLEERIKVLENKNGEE